VVCNKLLCRECLVVVEGKGYCKPHGERLLEREGRVASLKRRGTAISLASVLAVLDGLAGVVVGFLLIILGLLGPTAGNSPILSNTVEPLTSYFANVVTFPSSETLGVGFVLMILGTVDIIAGYYIWGRLKVAAIASVAVTSIAGGLLGAYLVILALAGAFTYAYIVSAVIKLVAIGYGWRHLRPVGGAWHETPPPRRVAPVTKALARSGRFLRGTRPLPNGPARTWHGSGRVASRNDRPPPN